MELWKQEIEKMEASIDQYEEIDISVMDCSMDVIRKAGCKLEAVEPLLQMIERHPTAYFGDPGAIVHFIEQFHPEYETCLLESLKRTPTVTTIWMLNRCMNAGECLNEGPGLLQEIANRADVDKSIREQAREYIGGQQ